MAFGPTMLGIVLLQLVAGIGLGVAGLVMTVSQRRMGPPENRWPLSRKITALGTGLVLLAFVQGVALAVKLLPQS